MSHQKPIPIPSVIDPYKHIMENFMPTHPDYLEGVHHHVKVEAVDGKIVIWVKDKHHSMEPEEARLLAHHIHGVINSVMNVNIPMQAPVLEEESTSE